MRRTDIKRVVARGVNRQHVSLHAVQGRDHLQLMPCVHRAADLEVAGGGVEVELVIGVEGHDPSTIAQTFRLQVLAVGGHSRPKRPLPAGLLAIPAL
jgi:hypothetical protein